MEDMVLGELLKRRTSLVGTFSRQSKQPALRRFWCTTLALWIWRARAKSMAEV